MLRAGSLSRRWNTAGLFLPWDIWKPNASISEVHVLVANENQFILLADDDKDDANPNEDATSSSSSEVTRGEQPGISLILRVRWADGIETDELLAFGPCPITTESPWRSLLPASLFVLVQIGT